MFLIQSFVILNLKKKDFNCARVVSSENIPSILKELFVENSKNLSETQKEIFAVFLCEFKDVFSQEIVAGNCNIFEYVINVKDSSPIKQVPRRIPIQLRGEMDKILEEMKDQGVIEESQSPWTSPCCFSQKEKWSNKILCGFLKT